MAATSEPQAPETITPYRDTEAVLDGLILEDQFAAVRRSVLKSLPVAVLLGVTATVVSIRNGHGREGLSWLAVATLINAARVYLCYAPLGGRPRADESGAACAYPEAVLRARLRLFWIGALASGLVWACIAWLCDGYTTPQTLFYLTVVCGITAGACVYGVAYARVPICFITPALLSVAACLLYAGGFDRDCLVGTVLLYLAALIRSALEGERGFRQASRQKNRATATSRLLAAAHARAVALADDMRHRAMHDMLTGLLNRAGFMQALEHHASGDRASLCLMLLDLDGFKLINDMFGHGTGDKVLIEVGRRLREALPDAVPVGRLGGDEFAVLFDPAEARDTPSELATRLIAALAIPFAIHDTFYIGVSIGVQLARGESTTEMLTCADAALYAAKAAGRNQYRLFDETLRRRLETNRDIERELPRAMAEGAMEVWYQPILGQGGRVLSGYEALLRWEHPRHGMIPPPDIVTAAAASGLSESLTRFVLAAVCGMIEALRAQGLGHVRVAMNVSPREVSQIAVDDLVLETLAARGLPPDALELEMTEETLVDIRSVQGKLAALSRAGVRVAIDDFGVGYSVLASLRQLHVDRIKIDRCFVSGIAGSRGDQALVQAILHMGHSLGIEVVAEGIETAEDRRLLQKLGCRTMQGYHLGRPMRQHEAIGWAREQALLLAPENRRR